MAADFASFVFSSLDKPAIRANPPADRPSTLASGFSTSPVACCMIENAV
ncbi:MAG: hypothetical protein QM533_07410 [Cytophagales bacterium]|nr:hypothetical protein [Cytophagales bacterium]